jgi:CBS-domain-containing membrane protein
MKVRALMSSPAHTVRSTDSLAEAARLLWENDCGMLPVVDAAGKVSAAITDRDICMGAYTRGRALAELRVGDSMSRSVVTCHAEDEVPAAVRLMVQHQLHRLPVVDAHGQPCGVLSLNDLALAGAQDPATAQDSLRALVANCHRRVGVPALTPATLATAGRPAARPAPATRTAARSSATAPA